MTDVSPDSDALDRALDGLRAGTAAWRALDGAGRARLLRACLPRLLDAAPDWVELGCRAKGIPPSDVLSGEEWLAGPMTTARGYRLTADTLEALPDVSALVGQAGSGGRQRVRVFPTDGFDRALYLGMTGDLWLRPGRPASRGAAWRSTRTGDEGVAVVLGAGNVSSIGPLDVLYMLAAHGDAVVLKLNPVNAYLRPVFARVFAPLIEAGVLAIVAGGVSEGDYLCRHPATSRVHLTGSRRTFDALMWGPTPAEQAERRAARAPRLDKLVTAELGCVTPILVVPGRWSESDLAFQARQVAASVTHNASFNCVAGKVLVLARGWPQRQAFERAVADALARTRPRLAYYPGAVDRHREFLRRYPSATVVGEGGAGVVPWTLLPDVPPVPGEYALSEEAFCGVLATTLVDASSPEDFLAQAVELANTAIEGTLSAMMLVHPATWRAHRPAVDRAIEALRYGSVAINLWSGVVFGVAATTWGAFPGHTAADVGSGVGVVHNSFLFDHPEKSVLRAPFRMWPTPVWFPDHRNLASVGRRLTAFEADPRVTRLPGLVAAAARG